MRKLLILFLSALSLTAAAQQPDWYTAEQRAANYPKSLYFTGIVYDEVRYNEAVNTATERAKAAARVEALSTIQVHVQNETQNNMHSDSFESIDNWSETIRETLDSRTSTKVDLKVPGLQVESWQNPNSREVVAFAYIKKSTLSRQMDKQVTAGLTRIETILENAEQFISNGQKVQAREVIKKAIPLFQEVEQAQRILVVADPLSDAESLQLAETKQLMQRYIRLTSELKNGINIYLSCYAYTLKGRYDALDGKIKGELSPLGCTFVNRVDQSDWAIEVKATTREHDYKGGNNFYVYVDTKVDITKTATGQRVYTEQLNPEKGGGTNSYDEATRDAYKKLTPIICGIIKEQITK